MAAGGTPANIVIGPGRLYYAALGTSEPTDCSTALPSAWKVVGYTEAGTTVNIEITVEGIYVAEELEPVALQNTKRAVSIDVEMAEATRANLGLLLGVSAPANSVAVLNPPVTGTEVAYMYVWDKLDTPDATNTRWVFRSAKPSGTIPLKRQKAPAKTTFSVKLLCNKTSAGESTAIWPGTGFTV